MSIYNYEQAFGAADKTTTAMRKAIERWFAMYYESTATESARTLRSIVRQTVEVRESRH